MKTISPSTLVLDIGNSEIDYALFKKGKILYSGAYPHDKWIVDNIRSSKLGKASVEQVFLGTVRPQHTKKISRAIKDLWGITPLFLQHPVPEEIIKINYKPAENLGMDRIANALACRDTYPLPILIVDFGTATTFTVLNQKGVLVGGAITTGIQTAWQTLLERAEQLPDLQLDKKIKNLPVIGNSTQGSLYSGFLHGFGAMVDGMAGKVKKELKARQIAVIATGGLAALMKPYCDSITEVDAYLTLKGYYQLGILLRQRG